MDTDLSNESQDILEILVDHLLLPRNEALIYLLLAKKGHKKAVELTKCLKINKGLVYGALKDLQSKGMVTCSMTHPMYFSDTSFKKILNSYINEETRILQTLKRRSKTLYPTIRFSDTDNFFLNENDQFVIIEGKKHIISKGIQMFEEAKKERIFINENLRAIPQSNYSFTNKGKKMVQSKMLTIISENDLAIAEMLAKSGWAVHHSKENPFNLHGIIIDAKQLVLDISDHNKGSMLKNDAVSDKILWTNNLDIIRSVKSYFEKLWSNSLNLETRKAELKSAIN